MMKEAQDIRPDDDVLLWNDAEQMISPVAPAGPWTVLVADDDEAVHRVTAMVFAGIEILGRPVRLIEAHSAGQAVEYMRAHPDTALILMDVIMEPADAGLAAVRAIREDLGNHHVRIVLRTGQPGHAPQHEMVTRYEIDGYEANTQMSAQRLITVATAAIRAYDQISANRAKSEFLANMSHVLRTPMHAILSFVEIARTRLRAGEVPPARMQRYLARIDDSGRRLLRLLDDLLDLAKLEEGRMRYDMFDHGIEQIIDRARAELELLLARQGVGLGVRVEVTDTRVWGDAFRLGQVLRNLLSNAVKYTPGGACVTVRVTDHVADGALLRVDVIDQGIGIPPGEEETIFDKFVQSSRTRSGAGGTGLALSICREIVHQHGGAIWACDTPQGGACLSFVLPRRPGAAVAGDGEHSA